MFFYYNQKFLYFIRLYEVKCARMIPNRTSLFLVRMSFTSRTSLYHANVVFCLFSGDGPVMVAWKCCIWHIFKTTASVGAVVCVWQLAALKGTMSVYSIVSSIESPTILR